MSTNNQHITHLRHDFIKGGLDINDLKDNPFEQFSLWMEEAIKAEVKEVQAMNVATVDAFGKPSSRIVYLRNYFDHQFVFFTNYESRKGREVEVNPHVCINFFWPELERQIRIEGIIKKHSAEASDQYFNQRPDSSKIGAWASPQSEPLKDRDELENYITEVEHKFKDKTITRPAYWGGYVVEAHYYEFWQGRSSRLHDRMVYEKNNRSTWNKYRIAP
jgi:pyridoxamine 5'-phosphate oxidase